MSTTTCTVSLIVMGLALVSPGTLRAEDETKTDKHVVQTEVHFAFDSAELTASARSQLDQAARWIREQKAGSILIEGHADLAGSEPYNKDLSERRAFAARDYLMAKGVPAEMVRILPYGEGLPAIDSNGPEWLNRRILVTAVQREPIVETSIESRRELVPYPRDVYRDRVVEVPAPAAAPRKPLGLEVLAGGGVTGFMDDLTNDTTDTGGMWTARVVAGSRSRVAVEAAYVGSAQDIDALGVDANATVLGSGLEADVRLNFTRELMLQPYVFAGIGWTHYQITNSDVNTSSIQEDDDVMQLPAGAGFSLRLTRSMIFDVRGTVRAAVDDGMFDQVGNSEDDGLESWSTTAHLGFGF